jgi:hypothetical protein
MHDPFVYTFIHLTPELANIAVVVQTKYYSWYIQ